MSSAEFVEWMAYYELEPFGQDRGDIGSAIVAATFANAFRGDHEPYTPADFIPSFEKLNSNSTEQKVTKQSPEYMLSIVEMLNAAHGGTDYRS